MVLITNNDLVEMVKNEQHYLQWKSPRDPRVLAAMARVDRRDFLPDVEMDFCVVNLGVMLETEALFKLVTGISEEQAERMGAESYNLASQHFDGLRAILSTAYPITGNLKQIAYADRPLGIGEKQTCSQPSLVGAMTDLLELEQGMDVLEVGRGCGYHAAVISHMVGEKGKVCTVECMLPLKKLGEKNLEAHFGSEQCQKRFRFDFRDGSLGWKEEAPYDRIVLTAGVNLKTFNPLILAEQLKPNGMLMFPEINGALIVQEYSGGKCSGEQRYDGIAFVPLKGENS